MIEIERKFLLDALPEGWDAAPGVEILQGYIAVDPSGAEVRLRQAGKERWLTVKQKAAHGRSEHNLPLTSEQWEEFWPLTAGRRLQKVRYKMPCGEWTAEIDVYGGVNSGLQVAEIEFPDAESAEQFTPPPWLGREVTGQAEYGNRRLATEE